MEAASGCCGQLGIGGPKVRGECFASLALPFEIRTCLCAITFRGGSGSGGAGAGRGGAGRGVAGRGWGWAGVPGGAVGKQQQQQQRRQQQLQQRAAAQSCSAARAQRVKALGGCGLEMPRIHVYTPRKWKMPGAGSLFWAKVACSEHRHSGGVSRPNSTI